jgi:general stress protein 26
MEEAATVGRPLMPTGYGISADSEGLRPWSEVVERLTNARNYWVATTRSDGRPHAVPVWGLWHAGAVYFSSDPSSTKGRNLARRPEVVVHLESGDDVVIVEGVVELVRDTEFLAGFGDLYDGKYQVRLDFTDPSFALYRVRPRVVQSWLEADFPTTATRWVFPGV